MPVVTVEMLVGRTLDQKRELSKKITDVMREVAKADPKDTYVVIHEVDRENWAIAGTLFSDKK